MLHRLRAKILKGISDFAAYCGRHRRVRPSISPVKVNVGSSLLTAPGWINVDGSHHVLFRNLPVPLLRQIYRHSQAFSWLTEVEYLSILRDRIFIHHYLTYGIPLPDDCADFVYTSHCLEHFYEQQARQLLQEAWRVLKPGGILRVCVPDLAHAMDLYQQGKKREALEYFFQSAEVDKLDRHKFMYDFALLSELLKSLGFQTVERCDYRKGRVPDLDILDNRPEQTLYVEAVK